MIWPGFEAVHIMRTDSVFRTTWLGESGSRPRDGRSGARLRSIHSKET
jgi:hypothetical protein